MENQSEQHQKWWQQIRIHPVRTILIALLAVVMMLIILSILGYIFNWGWTGLGPYISPPHPKDSDFQRGKTLWDWLGLLAVLAIPVVVGFGAVWFTAKQSQASEARNKQQHDTELQITVDNQRETALQAYINNLSELLLEKHLDELTEHLGELTEDDTLTSEEKQVREIARVRTLTVLPRLDGTRKRSVLLFLHEARLLDRGPKGIRHPIIDLYDADFSQACLSSAHLFGVSLSKVNLSGANLSKTYLRKAKFHRADLRKANLSNKNLSEFFYLDEEPNLWEADLTEADLTEADLTEADLSGANLSGANLSGAKLKGARYNMNPMLGKNKQGVVVKDKDANTITLEPTKWPKRYNESELDESKLRELGAICVDCK